MDPLKRYTIRAWSLIGLSLAVLFFLLWLCFGHRPPVGMPDLPPGGPGEPFRPPVKPEWVIVLTGVFILLVNFSVRAVKRVRREALSFPLHTVPKPKEVESIRFKTDYKTVTVALKDIRYVESMSEYVKIYLDSQPDPLVVLYSLKRLSAELPAGRFMRIHRSYIVALDRIRESSATLVVLEGDVALPVSATYREVLRSFISRK